MIHVAPPQDQGGPELARAAMAVGLAVASLCPGRPARSLLDRGPAVAALVEARWVRGEALDPIAVAVADGRGLGMGHALVAAIEDLDPLGPEVETVRIACWLRGRSADRVPSPVATPIPPRPAPPARAASIPPPSTPRPSPRSASPVVPRAAPIVRARRPQPAIGMESWRPGGHGEGPAFLASAKVTERWEDRRASRARAAKALAIGPLEASALAARLAAVTGGAPMRVHEAAAACGTLAGGEGFAVLEALKRHGAVLSGADGRLRVATTPRAVPAQPPSTSIPARDAGNPARP